MRSRQSGKISSGRPDGYTFPHAPKALELLQFLTEWRVLRNLGDSIP
ncbi:MAG TPA: hypothetical protein V6D43_08575 [Candidatus Sericytochromatia bacterium]